MAVKLVSPLDHVTCWPHRGYCQILPICFRNGQAGARALRQVRSLKASIRKSHEEAILRVVSADRGFWQNTHLCFGSLRSPQIHKGRRPFRRYQSVSPQSCRRHSRHPARYSAQHSLTLSGVRHTIHAMAIKRVQDCTSIGSNKAGSGEPASRLSPRRRASASASSGVFRPSRTSKMSASRWDLSICYPELTCYYFSANATLVPYDRNRIAVRFGAFPRGGLHPPMTTLRWRSNPLRPYSRRVR